MYQVIDCVDVPPGLFRGIVAGLDHIQMNAVGEGIPWPAENDHPHRAALRIPVGGEQPTALAGAHRPAGKGELQVPDAVGFPVADLPVGTRARKRRRRRGDFRHTRHCPAQRQGGRHFERGRPAGGRTAAHLRDPTLPRQWSPGRSHPRGALRSPRDHRAGPVPRAHRTRSIRHRRSHPGRQGENRPRAASPALTTWARPPRRSCGAPAGTAGAAGQTHPVGRNPAAQAGTRLPRTAPPPAAAPSSRRPPLRCGTRRSSSTAASRTPRWPRYRRRPSPRSPAAR